MPTIFIEVQYAGTPPTLILHERDNVISIFSHDNGQVKIETVDGSCLSSPRRCPYPSLSFLDDELEMVTFCRDYLFEILKIRRTVGLDNPTQFMDALLSRTTQTQLSKMGESSTGALGELISRMNAIENDLQNTRNAQSRLIWQHDGDQHSRDLRLMPEKYDTRLVQPSEIQGFHSYTQHLGICCLPLRRTFHFSMTSLISFVLPRVE